MLTTKCPSCGRISDGVFPVKECETCGEFACLGEGDGCTHACWDCNYPGCEKCMIFDNDEYAWLCEPCYDRRHPEGQEEE